MEAAVPLYRFNQDIKRSGDKTPNSRAGKLIFLDFLKKYD